MADSTRSHPETDAVVTALGEILAELRILTGALTKIMPVLDTPAAKWALSRRMNRT